MTKQENMKKASRLDLSYNNIIKIGEKILKVIENASKLEKLNAKWEGINKKEAFVAYSNLIKILNISIRGMLNQNINTFSDKLYFDILRTKAKETKEAYIQSRLALINKLGGENKYKYQVQKINKLVKDIEDLAQELKKFKSKPAVYAEKEKELQKMIKELEINRALRPIATNNVDIIKEVQKARKTTKRSENVKNIYVKVVKPLFEFLIKEGAIEKEVFEKVQQILLILVNDGYLKMEDENDKNEIKAKIAISYWPKEKIFNDTKYGYKGVLGLTYQETFNLPREETHFYISSEAYVNAFRTAKETIEKTGKRDGVTVFYPLIKKNKVLEDHELLGRKLKDYLDNIRQNLLKQGFDESTVNKFIDNESKLIQTYLGSTYALIFEQTTQNDGRVQTTVKVNRIKTEEKKEPKEEKKEPTKIEKTSKKETSVSNMPKELEDL